MCKNLHGHLFLARVRVRHVAVLFLVALLSKGYAWNITGHRLVGQIAYDHLTKQTKQRASLYNHALDKIYRPQSFVNAAAWLDSVYDPNNLWLREIHYISLPFSLDGTALVGPKKRNAVTALEQAKTILGSKESSDFTKGFYLRILLHVVGDIHQPLHAVNQFSKTYPLGDKGGNLVQLGKNSVAANLHAYWDRGGGFLVKSQRYTNAQLRKLASRIERKWL